MWTQTFSLPPSVLNGTIQPETWAQYNSPPPFPPYQGPPLICVAKQGLLCVQYIVHAQGNIAWIPERDPQRVKEDNFISLLVKTISTSFWAQVMLYTYIYNLLYVQCIQIIYLYSYTLYKECVQREYSVLCMSWAHFKRHSCNNTKTCTDTCMCTPDKWLALLWY